jgi:hypothetical protein
MSEIPYVNRLGDELERAAERATRQPARSQRRRRLGLFALAGALLVSGSALATGLLSGDVDIQAAAQVACYDGADPDFSGSVAVVPPAAGEALASPVELCRRALASDRWDRPLVACGKEGSVAVIPGRNGADCRAAGFAPLDPAYARARARLAKLERHILAIEASSDCIPRGELVHRVQRLLDRKGWSGWTAETHRLGEGPCGTVSGLGGDGRRYIAHGLDAIGRRVLVGRSAGRRITELLYSADRSVLAPLFTESGAKCFTLEGFRERVRQVFAGKGLSATVTRIEMARGTSLDDEDGRWTRYKQGCVVLAGGAPGPDADSAVVEVFLRP